MKLTTLPSLCKEKKVLKEEGFYTLLPFKSDEFKSTQIFADHLAL